MGGGAEGPLGGAGGCGADGWGAGGGVVCFDEYGLIPWEGESRAVDEYFAPRGMPALQRMPFSPSPSAYLIKEGQ